MRAAVGFGLLVVLTLLPPAGLIIGATYTLEEKLMKRRDERTKVGGDTQPPILSSPPTPARCCSPRPRPPDAHAAAYLPPMFPPSSCPSCWATVAFLL